jgi:hypothetical protein
MACTPNISSASVFIPHKAKKMEADNFRLE